MNHYPACYLLLAHLNNIFYIVNMKKVFRIVLTVAVVVAVLWIGAQTVGKWWIERKVERLTDGRWELALGHLRVNPLRRTVTFSDIEVTRNGGDKPVTLKELRIEKPSIGKKRIGIRRIVIDRMDTIRGVTMVDGRLTVAYASRMTPDESVRMTLDSLRLDTAARTLTVAGMAINPTYSKADFTPKSWNHGDWTQVHIGRVECSGVVLSGGVPQIDSIHIAGGSVSSYKDRNTSDPTLEKPMYHTLLQRFMPHCKVRAVAFEAIAARYEELPVGRDDAGVIEFDNIYGMAHNLDETISWSATARVQGAALLTARGTLPLRGDNFEISGLLDPCPATIFNSMATPLGNIEIRTGEIQSLGFAMRGTSFDARVELMLAYRDLSVEILNRHHDDRKLISNIVNRLLPNAAAPSHPTTGEFTRDPLRSPWNFVWKTIFAGLKNTLGIGDGDQ